MSPEILEILQAILLAFPLFVGVTLSIGCLHILLLLLPLIQYRMRVACGFIDGYIRLVIFNYPFDASVPLSGLNVYYLLTCSLLILVTLIQSSILCVYRPVLLQLIYNIRMVSLLREE